MSKGGERGREKRERQRGIGFTTFHGGGGDIATAHLPILLVYLTHAQAECWGVI
jgi:hypothetical protein